MRRRDLTQKRQWQIHIQRQRQWQWQWQWQWQILWEHLQRAILVTCDNWELDFLTIFVSLQLRVTLDSIRNSCDVYSQEACIDVQIFEFSLSSGGNNAKRLAWYNEANFALSTNCAKLLVKQSTIWEFCCLSFYLGNYMPFAFILPKQSKDLENPHSCSQLERESKRKDCTNCKYVHHWKTPLSLSKSSL